MSMPSPAPTPELQQRFEQGAFLHRQGHLAEAEQQLLAVIGQAPGHAEALRLLGVIALQSRQPERGLAWIERALAAAPAHPTCHGNRGAALCDLGRWEEALGSFDRAIALKPDYAAAHGNRGTACSRLGRFEEAVASYRQALALQPEQPDVYANLAAALCQLERFDEAVDSADRALALRPDVALARNNRGRALLALGRADEALGEFRQAVAMQPGFVEAQRGVAEALQALGHVEDAATGYAEALAMDSRDAPAWSRYGDVLRELGRYGEAIRSYDRAIELAPDFADAFCNRGMTRLQRREYADALTDFDRALAIRPTFFEALNNRGNALMKLQRLEEGIASFRAALALRPDEAGTYSNLAAALCDLHRYEETIASSDEALRRQPDLAAALCNRAIALQELGRMDEAAMDFARCAAIDPDSIDGHFNRGLFELRESRFESGWPLYEWRKRLPGAPPPLAGMAWSGREDVAGKSVTLYCEQGLGDTLQFIRYASLLCDRGARVTAVVQAPLLGLLRTSEPRVTFVAAGNATGPADFHSALMSLPLAFGTTLDTMPAMPGYLRADVSQVAAWSRTLPLRTRPRIGLAWSGSGANTLDHKRSMALRELEPMLSFPADWYVVQKGVRDADGETLATLPQVVDLGDALGDFASTAALMEQLDLIVTVDTSLAHLAGALGRPVWILLPYVADWRWLRDRNDSPWYPGARLFRQPARGDWASVVMQVRDALAARTWP
jgi:tetratricopeptide (TPR) repeat protein